MACRSVTVINYTSRCVNHLAAELAQFGYLRTYVRPYANQRRGWERLLERLPGMGETYRKTLGRRVMPSGFAPGQIRETEMLADFAKAALEKIPGELTKDLGEWFPWHIQRRIGSIGASEVRDARAVVASYVVAEEAFAATRGVRILSYPTTHHHYMNRVLREEVEREPEFSSSLGRYFKRPAWVTERKDAECELADYILVGSRFARSTFTNQGVPAEKVFVIPYGSDVNKFLPAADKVDGESRATKSHSVRVLYVGQIDQRKGISYLLRAYKAFHGPGTELRLVGRDFVDSSAILPYRALFQHTPHVSQSELVSIYQQADVFVFPSLIEGLGLVVLEAMASGIPVIVTPVGPDEIVRDGIDGFVVPTRDPDSLAEKLEYLRANPEVRVEMGRKARERALEFSWRNYRRNVLQFLEAQAKVFPQRL